MNIIISIPLSEWCLLVGAGIRLNTVNRILVILLKIWKKCSPQLIPSLSPFASIMWHPSFQNVMKTEDYRKWKLAGLDRFGNMSKNRRLHSSEEIMHKIGDTGLTRFQYTQVSSLVSTLMRTENVF